MHGKTKHDPFLILSLGVTQPIVPSCGSVMQGLVLTPLANDRAELIPASNPWGWQQGPVQDVTRVCNKHSIHWQGMIFSSSFPLSRYISRKIHSLAWTKQKRWKVLCAPKSHQPVHPTAVPATAISQSRQQTGHCWHWTGNCESPTSFKCFLVSSILLSSLQILVLGQSHGRFGECLGQQGSPGCSWSLGPPSELQHSKKICTKVTVQNPLLSPL